MENDVEVCESILKYIQYTSVYISNYRASRIGDALRVERTLSMEQRQGDWKPTFVEQSRTLLLFFFSLFFLLSYALVLVLVLIGVFSVVFRVITCYFSFSCYCCCCHCRCR